MIASDVHQAEKGLESFLDKASGEDISIEKDGRAIAFIISPERYRLMKHAEKQAEDISAYDQVMIQTEGNIPW